MTNDIGASRESGKPSKDPATTSEKTAPFSWARVFLGLAILVFLFCTGFRSGAFFRPAHPASGDRPDKSASALSRAAHPLRNLARMIALRPDTGDGDLGMSTEAFPKTLDSYWVSLNDITSHFQNPTPLSLFTASGQAILKDRARLRTQLTYSAIQGVMSSLNDPYTRFLDPSAFKAMQQDNQGSFAGIGAQLIDKDGKIVILKALPDTPAAAAHIMPMDVIRSINGLSADHMTSERAVDLIRGKPGTVVKLVLSRGKKLITVDLIRALINSQHFEYRVMDGDIGYMHLSMFDEQASDNIQKAIKEFRKQHVAGLMLDLRDNPGGLLNAAVDVASSCIPAGPVVWVQERGGQRNALYTNADIPTKGGLPLVVLVNHFSASASEIVSGAIKDTHSGTLIGLTTWGKGLVQEVIPLNDNSAIALTTAHYFTPNGSDINLKGVTPDVIAGHNIPEPETDSPAEIAKLIKERDQVDQQQLQIGTETLRKQIRQLSGQSGGPVPQ